MNLSLHRIARLTRWNAILLSRNRLTLFYAVILPLTPLALLLGGDRGDEAAGANAIVTVSLGTVLFPVYYNVLSQFVNRRDELVLKRMRTGETRDGELVASIALPGLLIALVIGALTVPIAAALGQRLPVNPVLYAGAVLVAAVMFTALAYWTAPLRSILERTPGTAMAELVRVGWFGLDGPEADETTLSFAETWSQAAPPLLVIAGWTALAVVLAKRSMRWEPRA
jgi:ABC-2 type transport system permease protein